MPSSDELRRMVLVRTYVSEERNASLIRVTRIGDLGTTSAVSNNRRTQRRNISCHPDGVGDTFLRNVDSNKSHTAEHPRRRHSSSQKVLCHIILTRTKLPSLGNFRCKLTVLCYVVVCVLEYMNLLMLK
jgi:hypothetical protein